MNIYKINKNQSDNYLNHQMIKEAFPGNGKVLWKNRSNGLLVLTNCDLNPLLLNNELIIHQGLFDEVFYRNFSDKMPFSIRLNACKALGRKRFSVPTSEINTWVRKKLTGLGFNIKTIKTTHEGGLISMRRGQKNTHNSVFVEGIIEVQNKEKLIATLTTGIGHAKAYGFGLLDVFQY